ncbi:MAG: PIN domain-containing protein [Pseudomonadota bacterium]|nr:PIN domain-containing protein [Pseudomonadota bacterium]
MTTVHYLVARYADNKQADELVDWLSSRFEIGVAGRREFLRARGLPFADFEDAVVCAVAEACGCDGIVTRNLGDFTGSPVRPLSPEEFLMDLEGTGKQN